MRGKQSSSRKIFRADEKFFRELEGDTTVRGESRSAAVSPSPRHLLGHTFIEMPRLHPLPLRFPQSVKCKSKKRGFCFCEKLFDLTFTSFHKSRRYAANWVRLGKSVILPRAIDYFNRAPENRNEVRFLGRGGAERACELCPLGRCESAADRSDEKAWFLLLREII